MQNVTIGNATKFSDTKYQHTQKLCVDFSTSEYGLVAMGETAILIHKSTILFAIKPFDFVNCVDSSLKQSTQHEDGELEPCGIA